MLAVYGTPLDSTLQNKMRAKSCPPSFFFYFVVLLNFLALFFPGNSPFSRHTVNHQIQNQNMSNEENIVINKVDNNDGDSSDLPPVTVPSADLGLEDRAILDALKDLELKRKFDVKTLSSKVSKRVLYLKDIQVQHDELEEKFHEEKAALEAKYDNLFGPLFAKRYEIVNGLVEVEEKVDEAEKEEVKLKRGVPNFWLIAMKTNELIANEITEQDERALKYLKDIKCCRVEEKTRNFKLEFLFDTNPYFKNSVLSKTYHLIDDDGPALEKMIGTNIEWCPGKCLTHKVVKKEPKKGSKKPNIPMTKTENCESFFNFFKPPEVPDIDELDDYDDFDTNMTEELQNLMDQDYEIAVTIRDKLIPHAVSWFTGEALVDDEELNEKEELHIL